MQSPRHEDFRVQSPPAKFRDRRTELGLDTYSMNRRDVLERSTRSRRRSLSPRKIEGSRREFGGNRRSNSAERRDYGWDLGGQVHKRPHYDEGISARDLPSRDLRRRYDLYDFVDTNAHLSSGLKNEYGYEHTTSRVNRDKDLRGSRLFDTGGNVMLGNKKSLGLGLEDSSARGSFRFPGDDMGIGPTSKYLKGGSSFSSASANLDLGHFKDERVRYPDPLLPVMEFGKGEKSLFHQNDVSYPTVSESQNEDLMGTTQFKEFRGMSSGVSRENFPGSYQGSMDEHWRSSSKLKEPLGFNVYGHIPRFDSGRDPEGERKDLMRDPRDTFSPTREGQGGYLNPALGGRETDAYRYPYDDLQRRISSRERVEYDRRDLVSRYLVDTVETHVEKTESSHRNMRESSLWEDPPMQKQTFSDYLSMRKSSAASKQGGDYIDSGSARDEFGRRVSREQEYSHPGISHSRLDYGFGGDTGPTSHNERIIGSPEYKYEAEMHRVSERTRMRQEEVDTYDSDRVLKRKYIMKEEMSGYNSKSIVSNRLDSSVRTKDLDNRSGEWIGEDVSGAFSSKSMGNIHNHYRRRKRTFDVADGHKNSASEDWLSSRDPEEHVQERYIKPYKPGSRHLKGHPRPGSSNWHDKFHWNRKQVLPRPNNVWVRGKDDNEVDRNANDIDPIKESMNSAKSEPPEDSEEFKQLVHKAFLTFTKRLNENPAVRKRYKEQGRAGSLFCIVCGRSLSKDFMDTKCLVTHAFMSHKVGLRAQHLGLHKAICVLLGWKSTVAPDVTTWVPDFISSSEALAQKEDLILWPPIVVIRNSSFSESDPKGKKLISTEALGDFLRGKGFSGGKIKISLGKPANHSILVVKFLGTFSGVQDAERLHKYFAENKHGRTDFGHIASGKGKSSKSGEEGNHGHKVEEIVLFGYMGIAEDLDKVDFETNKKCTIKSKKEIQDFANAPVQPE